MHIVFDTQSLSLQGDNQVDTAFRYVEMQWVLALATVVLRKHTHAAPYSHINTI